MLIVAAIMGVLLALVVSGGFSLNDRDVRPPRPRKGQRGRSRKPKARGLFRRRRS